MSNHSDSECSVAAQPAAVPAVFVQGDLIEMEPDAGFELTRVERGHTGARASKDWARVERILAARVAGYSMRQVCRMHQVGHNTVSMLERLHVKDLDTLRKRLAMKLGQASEMLVERLLEEGRNLPISQVAVPAGIMLDKFDTLQAGMGLEGGEAGAKGGADPVEELQRDLAARLERMQRAKVAADSGSAGEAVK